MHIKLNLKIVLLFLIIYQLYNTYGDSITPTMKCTAVCFVALIVFDEYFKPTETFENKPNLQQSTSNPQIMKTGLPNTDKIIADTVKEEKADNCNCDKVADKAINNFLTNRRIIDKNGLLHYADAYFGDMGYSDLKLDQYIPLGASGNGVYRSWNMAQDTMLNTDRWKPPVKNERQCITKTMKQPQPLEKNVPLSVLNWDFANKVMPPDIINVDYINEKLNKA